MEGATVDQPLAQSKPLRFPIPWFGIGLAGIFFVSLALRFWGLSRFNQLVFDEEHYVPHAYGYLTGQANFVQDLHPPLGRYMITLSLWLDLHNPFTNTIKTLPSPLIDNPDTFREMFRKTSLFHAFSYRWLTAFSGSCVPLVIAGIAYQVNRRRSFALIAGLFAMLDGYFIVESRYALINIYLVLFGLLGQLCFLLALRSEPGQATRPDWRGVWLTLTSVAIAASASIKWSGLWFLLGIYFLLMAAWSIRLVKAMRLTSLNVPLTRLTTRLWLARLVQTLRSTPADSGLNGDGNALNRMQGRTPLFALTQLSIWQLVYYLGVLPFLVYCFLWIPHLPLNQGLSLVERQFAMLNGHLMSTPGGHPNCSRWYTWTVMMWPVGHYWRHMKVGTPDETVSIVQGYGNPILWWLSSLSMVILIGALGWRIRGQWMKRSPFRTPIDRSVPFWSLFYIVISYGANLLPWMRVDRCTFLYHYLPSYSFAILALAWIIDRLLRGRDLFLRIVGVTIMVAILATFVFFLPIWLGLPLSAQGYEARLWLPTWDQGWTYLNDR